jgi:hypothetical protein
MIIVIVVVVVVTKTTIQADAKLLCGNGWMDRWMDRWMVLVHSQTWKTNGIGWETKTKTKSNLD